MMLSTDKNSDLWELFFSQLTIYWPNFNLEVVILTENIVDHSNQISLLQKKFNINLLVSSKKYFKDGWSSILKQHLREFPTKYWLFILDDYIMENYVDTEEISRVIKWIEKDKSIIHVNFVKSKQYNYQVNGYGLVPKRESYRFKLQIGIWRNDFLLRFLRGHETPWQLETWGNIRGRHMKGKVYHSNGLKQVFSYKIGGIVKRGYWNGEDVLMKIKEWGFENIIDSRGLYKKGRFSHSFKNRSLFLRMIHLIKSLI